MKYWDASGIVPLLVRQARTPDMERILQDDPSITTWWGTPVECLSALMRLVREGRMTPEALRDAERRLQELRKGWNEVIPTEVCRRTAERMLRVHALRAADAMQLAAALVVSDNDPVLLEVVCLDQRMSEAGRKEGFVMVASI